MYSIDRLATLLPEPAPAVLAAFVDEDERDVPRAGGPIGAARHVALDAGRILGGAYAFLIAATPEQRAKVDATLALVALGVHKALELRAAVDAGAGAGGAESTALMVAQEAAREAFRSGVLLRERTETLLKGIAGRSADLRARVELAAGTAASGEELASGLAALAALLREWMSHRGDKIAARVEVFGATDARARGLDEAVANVRETDKVAEAGTTAKVRQLQADYLVGLNAHILGELVRAFEVAHDADPAIPRLLPIASRRLLVRVPRQKWVRRSAQPEPVEAPPRPPTLPLG